MFRRLCQIDLTLSFFPFQKENESPVIWCNQRDLLEDEYWQKYLNDNDYDKEIGQHVMHQSDGVIIFSEQRILYYTGQMVCRAPPSPQCGD